jgi:hypothetical protein
MQKENTMKQAVPMILAGLLVAGAISAPAAQTDPPAASTAPARIHVNAPFAEQLIVKEKAMHPEIQKLGLHAVPPGQTQSAIVANNLPEKIGKLSSPNDLKLVSSGNPVAVRIESGRFFDTFLPLHDHTGHIIGFLIMEVPFTTATTEEGAIQTGVVIRDEVQRRVPTLESLFGPETSN